LRQNIKRNKHINTYINTYTKGSLMRLHPPWPTLHLPFSVVYLRFSCLFCFFCLASTLFIACDDQPSPSPELGGEPVAGEPVAEEPVAGEPVAGEPVAGEPVAGEPVAGEPVAGEPVAGEEVSGLCGTPRSQSERLVAVAFPFSEMVGEKSDDIGLFNLSDEAELSPWGERLGLGFEVKHLRMSADGWWLLALSERGELASVDLRGETPVVVGRLSLPSGAFRGVQRGGTERQFDLMDGNSQPSAVFLSVHLSCDGALELSALESYPLRLTYGAQRLHRSHEGQHEGQYEGQEVLIFGGQATFDPVDPIDLRWLRREGDAWVERATLDVYHDSIDALNLGFSAQTMWSALPNSSAFSSEGNEVRFIKLSEEGGEANLGGEQRFEGVESARGAWFLPSGDAVLVTQLEPGVVQVFELEGETWRLGQRITGLGLAEQLALTTPPEGSEGWWALVPYTSPSGGAGLGLLHTLSGGATMSLPSLSFGTGFTNIPGAVAAWPEAW
jgi:hypothetical protein